MQIKAIFHIDEMQGWDGLLRNLSHLLEETGHNGQQIEVLAHGNAVRFYTEASGDAAATFNELSRAVKFAACNNSLKRLGNQSREPASIC